MSIKEARLYIQKAIEATKEWKDLKIRKTLNNQVTSLDISYSTFKINNSRLVYPQDETDLLDDYETFINVLIRHLGRQRVFGSLEIAGEQLKQENLIRYGCLLISQSNNVKLVGATYRDIREILTLVANSPELVNTSFGTSYKYVTDPETGEIFSMSKKKYSTLELGHIGEQTPFVIQLNAVIKYSKSDPALNSKVEKILNSVLGTQADIGYTYTNTSDNKKLGEGIVDLVIQPRSINAKLSLEETKAYNLLIKAIQYSLKVGDIPGSNTLKKDGKQFITDRIVEKVTGKKQNNIIKHQPVKGKVEGPTSKVKSATNNYKEQLPSKAVKPKDTFSLVKLQLLINNLLPDVISANMGDGDSKRILNYRTGRFAASASVERMSQSRAGMITAFYTYMKYPYQTFEPGYRQGSPKTRDPKLLISQSIREIAATVVDNRMRAVLV